MQVKGFGRLAVEAISFVKDVFSMVMLIWKIKYIIADWALKLLDL